MTTGRIYLTAHVRGLGDSSVGWHCDCLTHSFTCIISFYSQPTILKDSRVSCDLTFKHKTYTGVGRNKHNAKLSASYKALKANDEVQWTSSLIRKKTMLCRLTQPAMRADTTCYAGWHNLLCGWQTKILIIWYHLLR